LTIFIASISWNQVIPFISMFLRDMGAKEGSLMYWVYGAFILQSVSGIVAQPFWGKLGDKYGQKPMIIRAGISLSFIYLGMSYCQLPWHLLVFRFLNGALTGFIPGSVALIATNTPCEEAPNAVATAQTASAAGQIIGPAVGGFLAAIFGYRGSMRVSSAATIIATILVIIFVNEAKKAKSEEKTSLLDDIKLALHSPVLISIMLAALVGAIFGSAIYPVMAVHLDNMAGGNIHQWLIGVVFSIQPAAFMLTARRWTRYGSMRGYDKVIQIGLIGSAVCSFILAYIYNIWAFSILMFIAGIFLAAISPSTAALIAVRVDHTFHGRAYGIQQATATFGALIAFFASSIISGKYGIAPIFLFVGISLVIGIILFPISARKWNNDRAEQS
jgi:DHA1 family multidrug resistance protein-like MFS transporter